MASTKPKLIFQIILGIFMLSFAVAACNSNSEKKETTDSTSMKSDTMAPAPMDTTKMDTAKPKPVKPGE
jgi:hypothetical protein